MIYTNKKLKIQTREMAFGPLSGVAIGERGRGRSEVFIPTPEDIEEVSGMAENLAIGTTRSGRPRIIKGNTGFFAIISSAGGYTRRGDGDIWSLVHPPTKTLATGNGADGAAGRIGRWTAAVLEMPEDSTIIRIKKGGGNPSDLVIFDGYAFHEIPNDQIEMWYDHYNIEIPFRFEDRKFRFEEWKRI